MSLRRLLTTCLGFGLAAAAPITEASFDTDLNTTTSHLATRSTDWWLPNIQYTAADKNYAPKVSPASYDVYIAVSTADELRTAISSGARTNGWMTRDPRVIYIAPGTYEFDTSLYMYTDTILVGDPTNRPVIKASSSFNSEYPQLVAGGVDQGSGDTASDKFSTQIKNVILDTTALSSRSTFTALSWRVAQNSALVNVEINLPSNKHTGITVGQGSTVQLGDVTINYGAVGLNWSGSQQGTIKNFVFNACTKGIVISSGFTVNIFHPTFIYNGVPITYENGVGAWVSVVDAYAKNSGPFFVSNNKYPNFMLENIRLDYTTGETKHEVVQVGGSTKVAYSAYTPTYVWGNTANANPIYQTNQQPQNIARPSALVSGSNDFYPVVTAPQYTDYTVDQVVNLKDTSQNGGYQIYGDGYHNDGPNLQSAIEHATSQGKLAFLPFGTYVTESTVTIPVGTNLYGMGWPAISGRGSTFSDESNPQPIVKVGNDGDEGTIIIQDMRFTVDEALAGAIICQVNAAGSNPGDVAIHNSFITVGGTADTNVNCNNCKSAYVGLHLTSSSSAYIDNFWAWVADHDADGGSEAHDTQAKGGVLIEATKGTWLTGLASEHWWLYNVNWNSASNVFMSLLQTETNYFQGMDTSMPLPPAPFTPTSSDPDFSWCGGSDNNCRMTIAQYWSPNQSSNIRQYASASWTFVDIYEDEGIEDQMNVESSGPTKTYEYGLCSRKVNEVMLQANGNTFGNSNGYGGSWGNLVAAYVPNGA